MRSNQLQKFGITFLLFAFVCLPAFGVAPKASGKKASNKSHNSRFRLRKAAWKHRGQQRISADRAREIQEALIREHYLQGQPTGVWDNRTTDAMKRFQAAQGWQSKVVPDSRALIKLGLGPSHENDLNPDLMGDNKTFTPLRAPEALTSTFSQR